MKYFARVIEASQAVGLIDVTEYYRFHESELKREREQLRAGVA
jgi:hypothetical protein